MEGDNRNPRVSLLKKYDIPIDHLSFEYIESCKDKKELERIMRILRSGEEGTYPDLIRTAETQLRKIAPESRVLRVETPILTKESFTKNEWKSLEKDLLSWEEEMNVMDKGLQFEKQRFHTIGNKNLPEVRKTVEKTIGEKAMNDAETKKIKEETNAKNERIKSGDYALWDKYDVDKELLKIDLEEERNQEKNAKIKRQMDKLKKQAEGKNMDQIDIDTESYSDVEKQVLANHCKDRGNESFKSECFESALKYYNLSIKLHATANAFNNRAMTYIKLKKYKEALSDCNAVLKLEPNNVKALLRRATSYQNLPDGSKDELALEDFLKIVSLEPKNRVAQANLQALKKKLNILDNGKKFRMAIEENADDKKAGVSSEWGYSAKNSFDDSNESISAIRKLPLTYYGPSTSTFQCEPHSLSHRMLSGSSFSGQVVCKCNSNTTRQNPLCYTCGEKSSRPKQTSKSTMKSAVKSQTEEKIKINLNYKLQEDKTSENHNLIVEKENVKDIEKLEYTDFSKKSQNEESAVPSKIQTSEKSIFTLNEVVQQSEVSFQTKDSKDEITEESISNFRKDEKFNSFKNSSDNAENFGNANAMEEMMVIDKKNSNEMLSTEYTENKTSNTKSTFERIEGPNGKGDINIETKDISSEIVLHHMKSNDDDKKYVESCEDENNKNTGNIEKSMNVASDNAIEKDNKNQSRPSTSQTRSKSDSKKNKNKKKKLKESTRLGDDVGSYMGNGRYFMERIKIASKYLKPTGSEPRPENDNGKETQNNNLADSKYQFESLDPDKKKRLSNIESNVHKSNTASHSLSHLLIKDTDCSPSHSYGSNTAANYSNCEGNKENILENGNECKSFDNIKDKYSEDCSQLLNSSFEFMKTWESVKKTDDSYERRAQIIRSLPPEDLKKAIGNNLDSDMLQGLLKCLEKHFLEKDPKKVISILQVIPQIPRFSVINLFLDRNERTVIERLIKTAENQGFTLDKEIKNSWRISF